MVQIEEIVDHKKSSKKKSTLKKPKTDGFAPKSSSKKKHVSLATTPVLPDTKKVKVTGRKTTPHPIKSQTKEKKGNKSTGKKPKQKTDAVTKAISFDASDDENGEQDEKQALIKAALKDKTVYPTPPFSIKPVLTKGVIKVNVTMHK